MKTLFGSMVFAVLMVLAAPGCGCSTVEPGTVGVAVNWGQLQDWTYPPGVHFYSMMTEVTPMSTRTETYTMADDEGSEGDVSGSVNIVTEDQLTVELDVNVQYHLSSGYSDGRALASEVYRAFGADYDVRIIHTLVRTAVRDAASEFTAIELVDERDLLQERMETLVRTAMVHALESQGVTTDAITIDNINLLNINLPDGLEAAILAVQNQHQETVRATEELATANAEAAARMVRATAEADSNRILSESLTPMILESRRIELTASLVSNEHTRVVMLPTGTMPMMTMPSME